MPNCSLKTSQTGFTYVFLLFLVALGGVMLATAGQTWWMNSKRDKEEELLFAGRQIREAIESYCRAVPSQGKANGGQAQMAQPSQFPRSLEDLLEDRRHYPPMRHLRRIFIDPVTGSKEWGLIREGERLVGVHSLSAGKPLRTNGFLLVEKEFASAATYQGWRFIANPNAAAASPGAATRSPNLPSRL